MGERGLLKEEKEPPEVSRKHAAKLKQGLQHQYNIFGRYGTWWQKSFLIAFKYESGKLKSYKK